MRPLLPVGEIVGVHGVKGAVKIRSHTAQDSIFRSGTRVAVRDAAGRESAYTIRWAKRHKQLRLVCFETVVRREQAEELIGRRILAEKEALPEPGEGEYYWDELIGLSVLTVDGRHLGRLENIIATGANDVYVVRGEEKETLVPALERVVKEIDLARGLMRVDLPEGL